MCRYNADVDVPKYRLPAKGLNGKAAYQLLHDELDLDGGENLNLASFVSTFATDEAKKLCEENLCVSRYTVAKHNHADACLAGSMKNLVDQDEYPAAQAVRL
jgi:glutamate decarboxylase